MQHLDPYSQALFRDHPGGHGADVEFLTREIRMANLVCMKALPMTLVCGALNQGTCYHTGVCHVDVKPHVRRHEIMAKCSHKCCQTMFRSLRRVEDPTTARHRAITSERQRLANCPLWCQPCRHGDRLDQQEEVAIVLNVLRQRRSARNTNTYSPRHTLLSASIRSWLSMSGNQNHDSPSCNLVHLGSARSRHGIFVLESAECKSNLPEKPCALPSTTERFSFERELLKLVLVQRGCQIARAEKGNERVVSQALSKMFHPMCETLKKRYHGNHSWQTRR